MPDHSDLFTEPTATYFEKARKDARRRKQRITFDCFNTICDDGLVKCRITGKYLSIHGPMTLCDCLRGLIAHQCSRCKKYNG